MKPINLPEFYALLRSGHDLIVADWLEDHDDEYLTEIARQLRGEHGKWLADYLYHAKTFNCMLCKLQPGWGYKFTLLHGHLTERIKMLVYCEDCLLAFIRIEMPSLYRWKVQSI